MPSLMKILLQRLRRGAGLDLEYKVSELKGTSVTVF